MKQVSDLFFTSPLSIRELLLERLMKDPELFLLSNSPIDTFIITTIMIQEVKAEAEQYNQTLSDEEYFRSGKSICFDEHPMFLRLDRDISILHLPYRIALIGWLLLPEMPVNAAIRMYKYAVGEDENREEQILNDFMVEAVKSKQITLERVDKIYRSSKLVKYISEKING
jgi:hypothetical protein